MADGADGPRVSKEAFANHGYDLWCQMRKEWKKTDPKLVMDKSLRR
jgi:hypothetical protein